MSFEFLKVYIIEQERKRLFKHNFYKVNTEYLKKIGSSLEMPYELNLFYQEIGHGFMYDTDEFFSIDRFLDPESFKKINNREKYYEFDPDLELYEDDFYKDKLIFFEVNEGVYLLINKNDINGKNAIYYFDEKIADSLEEFLIRFDQEGHYFEDD